MRSQPEVGKIWWQKRWEEEDVVPFCAIQQEIQNRLGKGIQLSLVLSPRSIHFIKQYFQCNKMLHVVKTEILAQNERDFKNFHQAIKTKQLLK